MKRVVVGSLAELQAADVALEYERKSKGLGMEFLEEFQRALTLIGQMPTAFRKLSPTTRRIMMDRFPYGLMYRETAEEVRVHAMIHLHSDPASWEPYLE